MEISASASAMPRRSLAAWIVAHQTMILLPGASRAACHWNASYIARSRTLKLLARELDRQCALRVARGGVDLVVEPGEPNAPGLGLLEQVRDHRLDLPRRRPERRDRVAQLLAGRGARRQRVLEVDEVVGTGLEEQRREPAVVGQAPDQLDLGLQRRARAVVARLAEQHDLLAADVGHHGIESGRRRTRPRARGSRRAR